MYNRPLPDAAAMFVYVFGNALLDSQGSNFAAYWDKHLHIVKVRVFLKVIYSCIARAGNVTLWILPYGYGYYSMAILK